VQAGQLADGFLAARRRIPRDGGYAKVNPIAWLVVLLNERVDLVGVARKEMPRIFPLGIVRVLEAAEVDRVHRNLVEYVIEELRRNAFHNGMMDRLHF
jgi:hypothetical protein